MLLVGVSIGFLHKGIVGDARNNLTNKMGKYV
jgi:hypothetical protein